MCKAIDKNMTKSIKNMERKIESHLQDKLSKMWEKAID